MNSIDFKDLRVKTDSLVFNTALEVFHQVLLMYLKAEEHGYGSAFKKVLDQLNLLIRAHSHILIPLPHEKHHQFNATISYEPEIDADTQMIEFGIDGSIYDSQLKSSHVEPATTKAHRVESYPGNQIFIH